MNPKDRKKDEKNKNMLAMDSSNQLESNSIVDEKMSTLKITKQN